MAFDALLPADVIGFLPAGADLSTKQYYFVHSTAGSVFAALTAGARVDGVLQDKPSGAGQACTFAKSGVSKLKLASAATQGAYLIATSAGEAITTSATGSHYVAQAMGTGVAGDLIPAHIGYFGAT